MKMKPKNNVQHLLQSAHVLEEHEGLQENKPTLNILPSLGKFQN